MWPSITSSTVVIPSKEASRTCRDVDDVKFVINVDFPNCSEDYIHRIGRTARSNNTGTAYTFFTFGNMKQAKDLVDVLTEANQSINPKLMDLVEMSKSFGGGRGRRWGGRNNYGGGSSRFNDKRNYNSGRGKRFQSRDNRFGNSRDNKYENNSGGFKGNNDRDNGYRSVESSNKQPQHYDNPSTSQSAYSQRSATSKFCGHHGGYNNNAPNNQGYTDNASNQSYGNSAQGSYAQKNPPSHMMYKPHPPSAAAASYNGGASNYPFSL